MPLQWEEDGSQHLAGDRQQAYLSVLQGPCMQNTHSWGILWHFSKYTRYLVGELQMLSFSAPLQLHYTGPSAPLS